tara:strand:- start:20 stop:577 length:558 start_codon:yes stop_codon:yes gene_type:complete
MYFEVKTHTCKAICRAKNLTLLTNVSTYARIKMTNFIKKKEISKNWLLIDAENLVVGRLAAYISKVLRGKNKTQYTPGMDGGDFIIVTNIEKIKFTGKKFKNKKYYRHTGHPGGIKETTPYSLSIKKPEEILKLAVKRMLPGGPLGKKQLSNLKIYKGDKHPHDSQNPEKINFGDLSIKNKITLN